MLVGDGWAFIHIPKCGGTSVRRHLRQFNGREVADVLPMGGEATVSHRFHWVGHDRPKGDVFAVIRHPAEWLASYWKMRKHEGVLDVTKPLDRLWCDNLEAFAAQVTVGEQGYIGRMFRAYVEAYEDIVVHRLEDGLEPLAAGRHNRLDGPCLTGPYRSMLEQAEPIAMDIFEKTAGKTHVFR